MWSVFSATLCFGQVWHSVEDKIEQPLHVPPRAGQQTLVLDEWREA